MRFPISHFTALQLWVGAEELELVVWYLRSQLGNGLAVWQESNPLSGPVSSSAGEMD